MRLRICSPCAVTRALSSFVSVLAARVSATAVTSCETASCRPSSRALSDPSTAGWDCAEEDEGVWIGDAVDAAGSGVEWDGGRDEGRAGNSDGWMNVGGSRCCCRSTSGGGWYRLAQVACCVMIGLGRRGAADLAAVRNGEGEVGIGVSGTHLTEYCGHSREQCPSSWHSRQRRSSGCVSHSDSAWSHW